ncbi:hypothetical protein GQ53DRAFT_753867 [Thozetella sp. PMI_491]|nr:hypothetical protein GQ53DRAFT_753867 [Thozetella sp. PMI_491]
MHALARVCAFAFAPSHFFSASWGQLLASRCLGLRCTAEVGAFVRCLSSRARSSSRTGAPSLTCGAAGVGAL